MSVIAQQDAYLAEFERVAQTRRPADPDWVAGLRRNAIARFAESGFPTTRDEEWRFTSVEPIARTTFRTAGVGERRAGAGITSEEIARFTWQDAGAEPLVFTSVNGRGAPRRSAPVLPPGLRVRRLRQVLVEDAASVEPYLGRLALVDRHAFAALNTAFMQDGVLVEIDEGAVIDRPVHLLFAAAAGGDPVAIYPRVLVLAGANSQARLVESYAGAAGGLYLTAAVSEIYLGQNAVTDHYRVQQEAATAFHMGVMQVRQERSSTFTSHAFTLGGTLVRNDIGAVLDGEGVDCTLNGLYVAGGEGLVDTHTTIDHAQPHCGSHEVYKGILHGRARGVFNGKIIVRPDAQKTDAKQTNKALLLTDDAQINTKPQLEIFANDVRCTHGATVGQLDQDAVFYLRARGIGEREARNLLIRAFAGEITGRVRIAGLRAALERALLAELPQSVRS